VLAAWIWLTIGIAAGSIWAYYTLGWGGWWFWDPVENASLMPWLIGTALLQSSLVLERRGALISWTILLAILTFSMSLVGTFLVRSGVLTSVHAFALDPARGEFVLLLLVLIIGAALALYAWRIPKLLPGTGFDPVSREGALVVNNLLFSIGMATVFLGTFYPLFAEIANGARLSVGPQFFNATFVPLMAPAIAIMVLAPMMSWRRGDLKATFRRLIPAAVLAVIVPLVALAVAPAAPVYAYFGLALATWAIAGVVTDVAWRCRFRDGGFLAGLRRLRQLPRRLLGGSLAHFGVGILVAGIAVSTAWRQESLEVMVPGQSMSFAGLTVTMVAVTEGQSENYQWQRAQLQMKYADGSVKTMSPERRFYPVAGSQTVNTAISTTGFADLYAALGDPDTKGGWVVRLYFNPLVPWIWFGAILAALGGMIALVERKTARRTVQVPADGTVKP
jgi:cytochrome c-type biogenesis protein CcmF